MLVRKEIRIVGLGFCKPDGMTLQDWVEGLKDKSCFISYDRTNEFDSNCMVARVDGDAIGNVNADDQRFVEPLLVNAAFTECEYKECYYTDSGNAILRYTIIIDLEDVSRFLPGEAWNDWSYDGELMPVIEDWKGVEFHLALLKRQLVMSVTPDRMVVEMCLDAIEKSSLNDLSYETTNDLMDLSFMMEMNSSPYCAEWKNRIQQISTHRRSRRVVSASINRWYQNLLKGEEVRRMLELYNKTLMLRCKHENITDTRPLLKEEFDKVDCCLENLPYRLYNSIEDFDTLYRQAFYTKIPRAKLLELFSACILRFFLKDLLINNGSLAQTVVNEQHVHVYGDSSFTSIGEMHIGKVIKNNGTIQ